MSITKKEIQEAIESVDEMFKAIPKSKQIEYLGHFNEVCLLLENIKREVSIDDRPLTT